jgi:hypothetical protein
MCNFTAVWGWFAAALVAIGGAVSSVIFGVVFIYAGPFDWLGRVAFFAAAMWAAISVGLFVGVRDALDDYCRCTMRIQACVDACAGAVRGLLTAIGVTIGLLVIACVTAVFQLQVGWVALALATALLGLVIALGIALADVSRCQNQPPTPPTPPTPPVGTGTAPTG